MSFIQIADLNRSGDDSLITLTDLEATLILGGTKIGLMTPSIGDLISPYTSASSISISSFSKNNILNLSANTKFNTSFTVDGFSVKPSIHGSIDLQFINPSNLVKKH